jgi:hypothetical protein
MAAPNDLAKMVPGFEFLQTLMKTAGAALPGLPGLPSVPGMGQWIAPTLDPAELDKRIQELKTVQFWLDQNAKLLGTTIQALEVQRMTLSTLQTMNLPMADLREALQIKPAAIAPAPQAEPPAPAPAPPAAPAPAPAVARKKGAAPSAKPAIDPMQWWGALTQQFTEIAAKAVKDSATDAAKAAAGSAVKPTVAVAGNALKKAATLPAKRARKRAA